VAGFVLSPSTSGRHWHDTKPSCNLLLMHIHLQKHFMVYEGYAYTMMHLCRQRLKLKRLSKPLRSARIPRSVQLPGMRLRSLLQQRLTQRRCAWCKSDKLLISCRRLHHATLDGCLFKLLAPSSKLVDQELLQDMTMNMFILKNKEAILGVIKP
jgi:hypothetical protein